MPEDQSIPFSHPVSNKIVRITYTELKATENGCQLCIVLYTELYEHFGSHRMYWLLARETWYFPKLLKQCQENCGVLKLSSDLKLVDPSFQRPMSIGRRLSKGTKTSRPYERTKSIKQVLKPMILTIATNTQFR